MISIREQISQIRRVFFHVDVEKYSTKTWPRMILIWMMASYAMYFFVRQNMPFSAAMIESQLGFSKTQIGFIISCWSIAYGTGKFLTIPLSERFSPRRLMTFGLMICAIVNIVISMTGNFYSMCILWSLNGLCQSIGWPQCVRLMSHWYKKNELATKWALASTTNQIGSFMVFILFGYFITPKLWSDFFLIPGAIALIASCFIAFSPLVMPNAGVEKLEEQGKTEYTHDDNFIKNFIREVLLNTKIWYIAMANFFVYIVRSGFCIWAPTYLKEVKGLTMQIAGMNMAIFEFAGAIGGITAGIISDKLFKSNRGIVGIIYMVGIISILSLLYYSNLYNEKSNVIMMFCLGFMFFGPQIMTGTASIDFSSKRMSLAANSFVGFFANFGSALVSGAFVGYIVQNFGWNSTFVLFFISTILAILFFALTQERK